ncbi:DUF502 domain-containing protein [Chelativorans sp. Marseille-P2723]|uniref:DUF502 domain-containing protein n=1 Tax=Chelativorans sp. Marseille-P2723 TaxID=2709133 RepID=UPI00157020E7|nr:DUF502 domain-containing protein [Chelativorans sp. Marseille-P2723]
MQRITRHIITGVLTIIPLVVTIWIVWFVVDTLIWAGRPGTIALSGALRRTSPELAELLLSGWFQSVVALTLALLFLFLLGRAANAVIGRRILQLMNRVIDAIPLARTIYGATQTLIDALRGDGTPDGERVVLIEFPNAHMRAVGFVTRIFPATDDREELAAVYVPTTPNPTSGFVEIVPTSRLIWLDWSKNDTVAFIVSGGAMAPGQMNVRTPPNEPA